MHFAALPRRSREAFTDGFLQPLMGVGNDKLHAGQPAGLERAKERCPEGGVLGIADIDTQDLPAALSSNPSGDNDSPGHNLAECVVSDVDIGGVEIDVRERRVAECPIAERVDPFVERRCVRLPISRCRYRRRARQRVCRLIVSTLRARTLPSRLRALPDRSAAEVPGLRGRRSLGRTSGSQAACHQSLSTEFWAGARYGA